MEVVNAIGRRKAAVARVFVSEGTGVITINKRDLAVYFPSSILQYVVKQPLNKLGVAEKYDIKVNLDGGGFKGQAEALRLAIARALVNDPQLIIADEPTGNIDPELSYEIVELLQGINDIGTTILMVTHEHSLVRQFGGRIINIDQGQIVFDEVIGGNLIHES